MSDEMPWPVTPYNPSAPGPTGRAMSTDGYEELYGLLLETSEEAPLEVLANMMEVMSTVLNRRLHDLSSVVDKVVASSE